MKSIKNNFIGVSVLKLKAYAIYIRTHDDFT